MKIKKRRRGRKYRWGKCEKIVFLYNNCLYYFIFQMMGAKQRIEDLEDSERRHEDWEEKKRKKI